MAAQRHFGADTAQAERRLLVTSANVRKLVDTVNDDPTDEGVLQLAEAFHALRDEAERAIRAGLARERADAIVGHSRRAAESLLLERLAPIAKLPARPRDQTHP
jgi:3-methyladenine DNA glycosylase/8-oxoguanine DNA glycosylase